MKNPFSNGLAAIPDNPAAVLACRDANSARQVQLLVRIPASMKTDIKGLAAKGETTVQALVQEAIADLLVKHQRSSER